jgi:hypothetical protein
MTSPAAEPEPTDKPAPQAAPAAQDASAAQGPAPAAPGSQADPAAGSLLPEQSREDTDAAWGDYRQRDDDRLYRDRPPHWDDF